MLRAERLRVDVLLYVRDRRSSIAHMYATTRVLHIEHLHADTTQRESNEGGIGEDVSLITTTKTGPRV